MAGSTIHLPSRGTDQLPQQCRLSDQFQLEPEQSTTAIVLHHPRAKYFNVSRYSDCGVAE